MSDNVNITPGSGATIACDEVVDGTLGTVKVQYVKLMDGTLDGTSKATVGANGLKVDGSAVTQPISVASLPLPSGAATAAKQPALGTAGTPSADVISVQGVASMTALKVDGSAVTQPVSVASLPLPSGASTAAKQPALGTAGTASADVITVQGIASMTALKVDLSSTTANATAVKVDGSAVTQPVSISGNQAVNVAQVNGVATTTGNGISGTGVQRVAIASDNSAISGVGAGATGSAVPANAVYNGGNASTALASAATAGNTVGAMYDKFGRQVVNVATIRDLVGTQTTTISASTTETTIVTAGAAGVFNDLVMLIISNTSSATNTRIDFRDATAGTILFSIQSNGGQPPVGFALPVPIPQTTAANNWTAQCATSTTDIRIYAVFAKNK